MKIASGLLLSTFLITPSLFAGDMGSAAPASIPTTYLTVGGGYFNGYFNSDFLRHTEIGLVENSFFNNKYDSYYGQAGIGSDFRLGTLELGQQFVVGKLADKETILSSSSVWTFRQDVDVGYDLMPKMRIGNQLEAFAIGGVHYAQFTYRKVSATSTTFDVDAQQLGFNLGVGARYRINDQFALDVRYQHLQYASHDANATLEAGATRTIDHNQFKPSYNLVGLQLNYYFS